MHSVRLQTHLSVSLPVLSVQHATTNLKVQNCLTGYHSLVVKRCVAIVAGVVSIVVSAILLFIWPLLFGALVSIGEGIVGLGAVGAGIYAFLNRLLIPTGLHHALNNVFWFNTIGLGIYSISGQARRQQM